MISSLLFLTIAGVAQAHTSAWANGMYCRDGNNSAVPNENNGLPSDPLYNLTKSDWWFQHDRGCDLFPPPEGEFLNLPAGGNFTVELAHNRAQTTLSYGGQYVSDWPDGKQHPDNWTGTTTGDGPEVCIQDDGAMHTGNQTDAAGTAFAISYESDLSKVTLENLVVFTTLEHTPWKRIATYEVPAALPACGPDGCTCAWLWVPKGCGQPNIYMQGYKCNVTGATSTIPLATAQPPVYCAGNSTACVQGAKQMIAWHQLDGNNIVVPGGDSPGYNSNCGWVTGAQNDIFQSPGQNSSIPSNSSSSIPSNSPSSSALTSPIVTAYPGSPSVTQTPQTPTTLITATISKSVSSTTSARPEATINSSEDEPDTCTED